MAASEDSERFLDPDTDPCKPPAANTEVGCLHCHETYDSYQIEWRVFTDADGSKHGFWCCPMPGCDGKGFGFDIFPTDPNYDDGKLSCVRGDEDDEDDCEDEDDGYFELDESDLELAEEVDDEADLESNGHPKKKHPDDPEPPSTNGHGAPW